MLAMAINPTLKLDWIRAHRTPEQAHEAELTLKHEMLRIQQALGFTQLLTWASGGNICHASKRARLQA
ncbi:hypothetical protein RSOL_346350, partial [Rhizoctonia solani AG-3 Rhs1AP]